jgi:predicted transcriptional regulator
MAILDGDLVVAMPQPSSVGERVRALANRMSRSIELEVRDAIAQVGDALADLEKRVDRMQHRMALAENGLDLRPELVEIGEDGLRLQRSITHPVGSRVRAFVDVTVWGTSRLLVLDGVVAQAGPDAEVRFVDLAQDIRDTLVAFVFQEQGREIRHAHARSDQ